MAKCTIGYLALLVLMTSCTGGSDDAPSAGNAEVTVVSAGAGGGSTSSTDEASAAATTAEASTTAPTTTSTTAAPTTEAPTTAPATTAATTAPTTATTADGTIIRSQSASFTSPTGNIACSLDATSGASCYIMDKQWTIEAPAGCEDDFGNGLAVVSGGAFYSCYTDFAWDFNAAPLAYGDAVATGEFICESDLTGVTCSNGGGQGFKVARARADLF